jgi:hypothetical protein
MTTNATPCSSYRTETLFAFTMPVNTQNAVTGLCEALIEGSMLMTWQGHPYRKNLIDQTKG